MSVYDKPYKCHLDGLQLAKNDKFNGTVRPFYKRFKKNPFISIYYVINT